MKAMKSLIPIAKWLLRIALLLIVYSMYFKTFESFKFNNLEYFVALLMVVSVVLLIVGGFIKKDNLTVIAGLVICILSVLSIFIDGYSAKLIFTHFPAATLGFYFLTNGN